MVFCGYNDTMADGLRLFVEGMIEAMLARHDVGVPMEEVLRTELVDLAKLNETLGTANREPSDLLNALVAINVFAQTIFSRSIGENIDAEKFTDSCRNSASLFVELVRVTEERHLEELHKRRANHGDALAIQSVGNWLMRRVDLAVDSNVKSLTRA